MNQNQQLEFENDESIKECKYKEKMIELKTESLDNEIKISEIIKSKLSESKYLPNFSYIIKSEPIEISQISEEISKCNLSNDTSSEYILCEYTNRPTITITDFLNKKANELDDKTFFRILLDLNITLQESLMELYKTVKIVHNKINETNIIISEEQIPIIKNFREANIMEENNTVNYIDIYSLIKMFQQIITKISISDESGIIMKYKEKLEKMANSEINELSINELKNLTLYLDK